MLAVRLTSASVQMTRQWAVKPLASSPLPPHVILEGDVKEPTTALNKTGVGHVVPCCGLSDIHQGWIEAG